MGGGFVFSHLTVGGLFEAAVVAQLLIDYGMDYTQPCTVQTCNLILCYCESIFEHLTVFNINSVCFSCLQTPITDCIDITRKQSQVILHASLYITPHRRYIHVLMHRHICTDLCRANSNYVCKFSSNKLW